MLAREKCPYCQGSGVRMIETSSMFGLVRKQVPVTCEECEGSGYKIQLPGCRFCEGQGLVGNEREICRACNGTGRIDAFGFVPREMLKPGVFFDRRCDKCGEPTFEIVSDIQECKETRSWEREEELRQFDIVEKVKVRCNSCGHNYFIPVNADWHEQLSPELFSDIEDMGINLSFMYHKQ